MLKTIKDIAFASNIFIPKGTLGSLYTNIAQLTTHAVIVYLATYHADMLLCYQAFWHIAEGNKELKGTYINKELNVYCRIVKKRMEETYEM